MASVVCVRKSLKIIIEFFKCSGFSRCSMFERVKNLIRFFVINFRSINSLILRGVKTHNFRIIVQTRECKAFHNSNKNNNNNKLNPDDRPISMPLVSKCEPKIIVTESKWTLLYGTYEREETGLIEIQVSVCKDFY